VDVLFQKHKDPDFLALLAPKPPKVIGALKLVDYGPSLVTLSVTEQQLESMQLIVSSESSYISCCQLLHALEDAIHQVTSSIAFDFV
jgi:hypothetical protein